MIKRTATLLEVKQKIKSLKLKPVSVTINLGRNKLVKFTGTLVGVYPALFTVTPFVNTFKGKTSYSYSEYLCGKVSLSESRSG